MFPLGPDLVASCVLERVHHGFFEPHLFQMRMAKATLQNVIGLNTKILRRGDLVGELSQRVQVLVIEAFDDVVVYEVVKVNQIADHASLRINRTTHSHFKVIVVPVAMGIVALAVRGTIPVIGHRRAVQPV
jgi:hypothetical protein